MAVGTVSSINDDVWQLIGSSSLTSGTSYSFTSISGYKTLMLTFKGVTTSANSYMAVRLNNDSTAGNYSQFTGESETRFLVSGNAITRAGGVIIHNANQDVPHKVELTTYSAPEAANLAFYLDPTAINRVDLISRESYAFTAGTVYLYGIAA